MATSRSVFVTGANGYIGSAVCHAFIRAGWHVYGLVRRQESAASLVRAEVVPVVGSLSDLTFLDGLYQHTKTFNTIVSCTDDHENYISHYHEAIALIRALAEASNKNGVRPLVLWTSGCKDYGTTDVDGAPGLSPHTEQSPLNAPAPLVPRKDYSLKTLENKDLFDAAVLRPTNVYGYSSSYYAAYFELASHIAASGVDGYELDVDPRGIMHALHIDDCAEAYVALAEYPTRSAVAGECFNISAHKYETAEMMWKALEKEFKFAGPVKFVEPGTGKNKLSLMLKFIFGWSQWVSSEKIRELTGWTDKRLLFTENMAVYRAAYDMAVKDGHEGVSRIKNRAKGTS